MSNEAKTVQRYYAAPVVKYGGFIEAVMKMGCRAPYVLHSDYAALEARCAELEAALKWVIPEREICEDDADGDTCCELSNGDVRAAIAALANAQKEGA